MMPAAAAAVPSWSMSSSSLPSASEQTFLAFDFGTKRTGVAVGHNLLLSASALKTLAVQSQAPLAPLRPLARRVHPHETAQLIEPRQASALTASRDVSPPLPAPT